ncbi:TPA_asm: pathogenicity island 2 effector protein SseD, partial [Salmonella enterica subsp. enterica serovar 4,[5],12:i:-]|nr:pathogenicity island 2 effector protein SseD [Salmonella enterica]HAE7424027.1 pathogenicity island 2 effector protein SseD [Salmonella enterica subsp. enterica serovar 4,[5],12:i:-]
MEASNVALVLPAPSLLTPSSTPSPSGEGMGTESMLLLF